jgi:hypothetical protein
MKSIFSAAPGRCRQELDAAFAHDHHAVGQRRQLFQHRFLVAVGFAQHRVQRGDDGHAQLAQQRQDVRARTPAEDAVLVLQAHEINIIDVEKVRGPHVRIDVPLGQLEAHAGGVGVAVFVVIDREGQARRARKFGGDGLAQVGREGGDATLAGKIVANEGDTTNRRFGGL